MGKRVVVLLWLLFTSMSAHAIDKKVNNVTIMRVGFKMCIRDRLRTTGMKIATTPVELITEPNPATASISSTSRRASLLPARAISQSPTW